MLIPMSDQDKKQTIFGIISSMSGTAKRFIHAMLIVIPILIIFVQVYYGLSVVQNAKQATENTINTIKSNKYDLVASVIRENYKHAKLQTDSIKFNIVKDLANEYHGNLEIMYQDYLKRDLSSPFYRIISQAINEKYLNKDSSHNRVFIASRSHILLDNSMMFSHNTFREWDSYIDSLEDGRIIKKSLLSMTSDNNDFVLWIDEDNSQFGNVIRDDLIDDLTVSEFIKAHVMEDKMKEMGHFSIAVVSFIFDHRDIFDVPDVVDGKIMNNDKIYVIEIFNIGDIIETNQDMLTVLAKYDRCIEMEKIYSAQLVESRVSITLLLVILTIIVFFGIWYLIEYQMFSGKLDDNKKN